MNKTYTSEEIKNRLLNIGEAIGQIAFDYIVELEKEIDELKNVNAHDKSKKKKRWGFYSMLGEWIKWKHTDCPTREVKIRFVKSNQIIYLLFICICVKILKK